MSVAQRTPYQEFADFMTSSPSLRQITEFRLSDESESRINDLLAANRDGTILSDEQAELEDFARLEHLMRMLKIRAFEKLEHS